MSLDELTPATVWDACFVLAVFALMLPPWLVVLVAGIWVVFWLSNRSTSKRSGGPPERPTTGGAWV